MNIYKCCAFLICYAVSMEWQWKDTNDAWIQDVPDPKTFSTEPQNAMSMEWDWGDTCDWWIWD